MDIVKKANYTIGYEKRLGTDISLFLCLFKLYAFELKPLPQQLETGSANAGVVGAPTACSVPKEFLIQPRLERVTA